MATSARASGIFLKLAALSCVLLVVEMAQQPSDYYYGLRSRIIRLEKKQRTGGIGHRRSLSPREMVVDELLMEDKRRLFDTARAGSEPFPMNFLTDRAAMENSTTFRIIQKMPKGALLHAHTRGMASLDWLVSNLTYRPHLYMCVNTASAVRFRYSSSQPAAMDGCGKWDLVSNYRAQHGDPDDFDNTLYQNLSLVTADPASVYPDINSVWDAFEEYFDATSSIVFHRPVWRDYLWRVLEELMQDNVQYVEFRGGLPKLYELDGTEHESEWSMENVFYPVLREFRSRYPRFLGFKLILTSFRGISPEEMLSKVQFATRMYQKYPDMVVGFDVVGQEDTTWPLSHFLDAFLYPSRLNPPVHLPYFFHAGETVWQETETDYNLLDALLLNTTRIGHGYALLNHPVLMKMVRNGHIAVEVSPISNQVLKLVLDLRNHPAAFYLSTDLPVVIASDDPAVWDALPLSHDFHLAFMALLGEDAGLASLKQLARNSIKYSAMSMKEKVDAMRRWQKEWDLFITVINHMATDDLLT